MAQVNLTHHFLIAMPSMDDPHFARSLTYICEHNEQGALGLVVNRPTDMTLSGVFDQLDMPLDGPASDEPVYFGGPVQTERGFVLHQPVGEWQSSLAVQDGVALTTSRDILEALGRGDGPQRMLFALGYSGWGAGQLEQELKQNAWLTVAASDAILFDLPPEARLEAAMQRLGVNFASLLDEAGHA
jgi:putative transcriptional regulator